jgi:hypothetical protein
MIYVILNKIKNKHIQISTRNIESALARGYVEVAKILTPFVDLNNNSPTDLPASNLFEKMMESAWLDDLYHSPRERYNYIKIAPKMSPPRQDHH